MLMLQAMRQLRMIIVHTPVIIMGIITTTTMQARNLRRKAASTK
jgi:hypothetical protein